MSNFEKHLKSGEEIMGIILVIITFPIWIPFLLFIGMFVGLVAGVGWIANKLGYTNDN